MKNSIIFVTIVLLSFCPLSSRACVTVPDYTQKQGQNQSQNQLQLQAQLQGQVQTSKNYNTNNNTNRNTNQNCNSNANVNINQNSNTNRNANNNTATNYGNSVSINDNSTVVVPQDLLSPVHVSPLDRTNGDLSTVGCISPLQGNSYTVKELTSFANPGKFLGMFWEEWSNTYNIELAMLQTGPSCEEVSIIIDTPLPSSGYEKIGEALAYAKKLDKSENQVLAALAVRAAKKGACLIVFRTFSNPVTKVNSAVIGGGGIQMGSSTSTFQGATGIGSSTGEKLFRAYVVAELYGAKSE